MVALGVASQLLAVLVGPLDFVLLLREQQFQREALYVGGHDRIDFEDLHFNPNYNQILGNWILVRCLLHLPPPPGDPKDASLVGTDLYDAIPPQVWVNAARWDFAWNLRRSQKLTGAVRTSPVKATVNARMRFFN